MKLTFKKKPFPPHKKKGELSFYIQGTKTCETFSCCEGIFDVVGPVDNKSPSSLGQLKLKKCFLDDQPNELKWIILKQMEILYDCMFFLEKMVEKMEGIRKMCVMSFK